MEESVSVEVIFEKQQIELEATRQTAFEEIYETLQESQQTTLLKSVNQNDIKVIDLDDKNKKTYTLKNKIGDLGPKNSYKIELTWPKKKLNLLLQHKGKTYQREYGEQTHVQKIIELFQNQMKIPKTTLINAKYLHDGREKKASPTDSVRILVKRAGPDVKLLLQQQVKKEDGSSRDKATLPSQKLQSEISANFMGNSLEDNLKKSNISLEPENDSIDIVIEMNDLEKTISAKFTVPNTYSFLDLRPLIDQRFQKQLDYWDENGQQQLIINDADNKNTFKKLDQPFKRIFKGLPTKTFLVTRKYPGGQSFVGLE